MQFYRTREEAVIEMTPPERNEIRERIFNARQGDRIALMAGSRPRSWEHWSAVGKLTICVTQGRGFNAFWEGDGALQIDVGEGGAAAFADVFSFDPGQHMHYDPVAFPEETNDTSVPLIVQDEKDAP
jgi:hypothetical protein